MKNLRNYKNGKKPQTEQEILDDMHFQLFKRESDVNEIGIVQGILERYYKFTKAETEIVLRGLEHHEKLKQFLTAYHLQIIKFRNQSFDDILTFTGQWLHEYVNDLEETKFPIWLDNNITRFQ